MVFILFEIFAVFALGNGVVILHQLAAFVAVAGVGLAPLAAAEEGAAIGTAVGAQRQNDANDHEENNGN